MQPLRFAGEIAGAEAELGELLVFFLGELELQAAPAFVAEPHPAAAGVEQGLISSLVSSVSGDVEDDAQVEPIDAGLLDFEPHGSR